MKKKVTIAIIALIILAAYPTWKIQNSKSRVNHLFQQISVGMPIEKAESLARELDLNIIKSVKSDTKPAQLIAWEGWAFARWTCFISYEKGRVQKKEALFLD